MDAAHGEDAPALTRAAWDLVRRLAVAPSTLPSTMNQRIDNHLTLKQLAADASNLLVARSVGATKVPRPTPPYPHWSFPDGTSSLDDLEDEDDAPEIAEWRAV